MPYLVHRAQTLYNWTEEPIWGSVEKALNDLEQDGWRLATVVTQTDKDYGSHMDTAYVFHKPEDIDLSDMG